jgi:hypothetical protein
MTAVVRPPFHTQVLHQILAPFHTHVEFTELLALSCMMALNFLQ